MEVESLRIASLVLRRVHSHIDGRCIISTGALLKSGVILTCAHSVSPDRSSSRVASEVFVEGRTGSNIVRAQKVILVPGIDAALIICNMQDEVHSLQLTKRIGFDGDTVGKYAVLVGLNRAMNPSVCVLQVKESVRDDSIGSGTFLYNADCVKPGYSGSLVFLGEFWLGMHIGVAKEHGVTEQVYVGVNSEHIMEKVSPILATVTDRMEEVHGIYGTDLLDSCSRALGASSGCIEVLAWIPLPPQPLSSNGLFHWLSTQSQFYVNAAKKGLIGLTMYTQIPEFASISSASPRSDLTQAFVNCTRRYKECYSAANPGTMSYFIVDVGQSRASVAVAYALRHGSERSQGSLTSWVLEGKLRVTDAWCVLSHHVNDASLADHPPRCTRKTARPPIGTWSIPVYSLCRYYRIRMTSPNSEGGTGMAVCGMELYGLLTSTSDSAPLVTAIELS